MAEAQLELDVSPALQSIEDIDEALDDVVERLQRQLDNVLTEALQPQIDDIGQQLTELFASIPTSIADTTLDIDASESIAEMEALAAQLDAVTMPLEDQYTFVLDDEEALTSLTEVQTVATDTIAAINEEAVLDIDTSPAQDSLSELDGVFTDTLIPQIDSINAEITSVFDNLEAQIADVSGSTLDINVDSPDLADTTADFESLGEQLDSTGEESEKTGGKFNLLESAANGLEVATGTLEGQTGSLLRTMIPSVAIFGGITAAVAGLVERGDQAILSTERLNNVFGDSAPTVFDAKLGDINMTLGEFDKASGASNTQMRLLVSTFGETAIGAGATREEAANTAQQMGFLATAVTTLNPALGTADQNFQLISRGLGGSARLLQRYGITIDQTRQAELALQIAHDHGREKVSLYDKQVAGLQLSMEALRQKAADSGMSLEEYLNKGLDNSTVKFRALRLQVSSTLTEIGKPIVEAGLAITEAFTPAIQGVIRLFGGMVDLIVPLLVPLAQKFSAALQPIFDALPNLLATAQPIFAQLVDIIGMILIPMGPSVQAFVDLAQAIGRVATPFILDFLRGVKEGLETVQRASQDAIKWIREHLGPAFEWLKKTAKDLGLDLGGQGGLAESLGKIAVAVGVGVTAFKVLGPVVEQVGSIIEGATTVIGFLTSPIGLVVAAIALLGLGAYQLYQHWEPFRNLIDNLGRYLRDSFIEDLRGVAEAVGDVATAIGGGIIDGFNAVADAVEAFAESNTAAVIGDIAEGIYHLWEALSPIAKVLAPIALIAGAIFALGTPIGLTGVLVTALVGAFAGLGALFSELYQKFEPFRNFIDKLWEKIQELAGVVIDAAMPAFEKIGGVIEDAAKQFDKLMPKIEKVAQVVITVIGIALAPLIATFKVLFDFLTNEMGPVFDYLGSMVEATFGYIASVIEGAVNIIMGILQTFFSLLTGDWQGAWDGIKQIFEGVWQLIVAGIKFPLDMIIAIIQLALGTIGAIFRTAWDLISDTVKAVWSAIRDTIMFVIGLIVSYVSAQIEILKTIWETVWNAIKFVASAVWEGIKTTVTTYINAVHDIIVFVLNLLRSVWDTVWHGFKDVVSDVWNGIKSVITTIINGLINGINAVIGLINAIPDVHIPGTDIDIGIPEIPKIPHFSFHTGGMVPGKTGEEVLAVLQAGERVQSIRQVQQEQSQKPSTIVDVGGIQISVAPPEGMDEREAQELAHDIGAETEQAIRSVIGSI